jgi:ABC-type multidrug transport system fused ATPase/permease subunit
LSIGYLVSYLFKSIEGSTRVAPLVILLTLIIYPLPKAVDFEPFSYLIFFLLPSPGFLAINMIKLSESSSKFDFGLKISSLGGYITLVLSTVFYFFLAVYLDSRMFKLGSNPEVKRTSEVNNFSHKVIDELSFNKQIEADQNNNLEIQLKNLSKVYEKDTKKLTQALSNVLEVKDEKKKIQFLALKNLSLSLRQNEILGIIGPNGAGKSTIFGILGSAVSMDQG